MAQQQHIVKRQVVEVSVADQQAAQAIPDRISQWARTELPQMLDRMLSNRVPPDVFPTIDRLELDLGALQEDNLEEQITRKVKELLSDQLAETVFQAEKGLPQAKGIWQKATPKGNKPSLQPRSEVSALFFYWQQGVLPWWLPAEKRSVPQLVKKVLGEQPKSIVRFWINSIQNKNQRRRILATVTWRQLLQIETAEGRAIAGPSPQPTSENEKQQPVLATSSSAVEKIFSPWRKLDQYFATFWKNTPWSTSQRVSIEQWLAEIVLEQSLSGTSTQVETILQKIAATTARDLASSNLSEFKKVLRKKILIASAEPQAKESPSKAVPISRLSDSAIAEEGIPVDQVGLILLWPYLQLFFRELGLVVDGQFVDRAAQEKGVHLLQYMAQGDVAVDEPEWVIPKLICGLAIEDFVPLALELSDTEKEECDNLLMAVIRNWTVLKNTSPDSLRATFLLRSGLLSQAQGGWLLQIERQGIDILIDRLPWPISVIKLPWNDFILNVKW